MSVKAHDLPDLIAAAVRKAVADKVITDENLAQILHHPITIGLVAASAVERPIAAAHTTAAPTETPAASSALKLPIRLGFWLNSLEELKTPEKLKAHSE